MSQKPPSLGSIDLREISAVIEALEKSRFNYLDMQIGELHITLGDRPASVATPVAAAVAAPVAASVAAPVAAVPASPAPMAAAAAPTSPEAPAGTTAIRSPMVGRFYARPEPGAELYVNVGDRISADTTVGLVEVMKVFNAVTAGVAGEVVALAVQDGDFVEFDQPLAYVKVA